jgi:1-acyl-sn-glycerol-3-phosphate acyltransferase
MRYLRAILRICALLCLTLATYPFLLSALLLDRVWSSAAIGLRRRVTRLWALGCLFVLGVRLEVLGTPPTPPFFAAGNHLSYLDILVLHASMRGRFLSKAEIGQVPFAGHIARLAGTLFVKRERKRELGQVRDDLGKAIRGGEGVIVFPEGTSTSGATVLPFRASLFQVAVDLDLPVAPFALHYAVAPSEPPAHLSVCWWGEMEMLPHFLGFLMLPRIEARVTYIGQEVQAADRKLLAHETWTQVQEHFQPSCVN